MAIAWIIPLLPFIGATTLGIFLLVFSRTMNRLSKPVAFLSISCLGASLVISYLLSPTHFAGNLSKIFSIDLSINNQATGIQIGLLFDSLSGVFIPGSSLLLIGLMLISHKVMYRKEGYVRFFILLGFFSGSILVLVSSLNYLEISVAWLILGLILYYVRTYFVDSLDIIQLVIDSFSSLAFFAGVILLFLLTGSFGFDEVGTLILQSNIQGDLSDSNLTLLCLLLFIGTITRPGAILIRMLGSDLGNLISNPSEILYFLNFSAASSLILLRLKPVFEIGYQAFSK